MSKSSFSASIRGQGRRGKGNNLLSQMKPTKKGLWRYSTYQAFKTIMAKKTHLKLHAATTRNCDKVALPTLALHHSHLEHYQNSRTQEESQNFLLEYESMGRKLAHAAAPFRSRSRALPLRFQIGVVSISWWGTSLLSRFVSFTKFLTFSLAISASSSGVISLTTTVSRHSGLTLTPHLPLAW